MAIARVPGWSDGELWRAALDAPRRAYLPHAGLEVIERPGWLQLVAPAFREGGLNGVWHAALADDEADAAIDRTIAQYAALGVRFRWLVDPESRPLDLADRLARRGLSAEPCRIMVRATARGGDGGGDDAWLTAPLDPDLTIERVDDGSIDVYDRVTAAGWEQDSTPFAAYHRALLADPARAATLYLARRHGQPAAVASARRVGHVTYLVGGVVLPEHRGHGIYRALVAARLRDAAAAGLSLAVTLARARTSAPILDRLGFATVCEATSLRA